jgi:ABC-type amino acid transport substrate-binding protein
MTHRRRWISLLGLLAIPGFLASAVPAGEPVGTLDKVKSKRTLTLGHRDSSRPFSFVDDDGRPAGYSVDLCLRAAAAIQKQLGLADMAVRWVKVTPQDRIEKVVNGTIDIECGSTTSTLSRQEQVDFTSMTFVDGGGLLVTDASRIDTVADLDGKRVALIRGSSTEAALGGTASRARVSPIIVPVRDHAEGVAALDSGRADAYASDRVMLMGLGRTSKHPEKLSLSLETYSYEPYGLMVRRGDSAFRLAINRELARLYRSGDITEIYLKWFKDMGRPSAMLQAMYILHALPE